MGPSFGVRGRIGVAAALQKDQTNVYLAMSDWTGCCIESLGVAYSGIRVPINAAVNSPFLAFQEAVGAGLGGKRPWP